MNLQTVVGFGGKRPNAIWSPLQQLQMKDSLCARYVGARGSAVRKFTRFVSQRGGRERDRPSANKLATISVVYKYNERMSSRRGCRRARETAPRGCARFGVFGEDLPHSWPSSRCNFT